MRTEFYDLIVIGGGAAGVFGALACAGESPASRILVLEKNRQPLTKVLLSGGGRCNLTYACFDPAELVRRYPRGANALRSAFSRFQPRDTIQWFELHGVPLKAEPDHRIFPVSDRSQTVVDCLLAEARRLKVELRCDATVTGIKPHTAEYPSPEESDRQQACNHWKGKPHFHLTTGRGENLQARSVLIATGGTSKATALAALAGHTIVPPVPSLFTFEISDPRLEGLAGVSVKSAELRLPEFKLGHRGPLLVTHWGLSGPAVLHLSAFGARQLYNCRYRTRLIINWMPKHNPESLFALLWEFRQAHLQALVTTHDPTARLPQRLWQRLAVYNGIPDQQTWTETSRKQVQQLVDGLSSSEFTIIDKGEFKEEFVTCGGVALDEVDFKTMQSKLVPGLFLAGEVLDVDGVTGGFNLQAAWTTGYLAGRAAAQFINSVN